MKYLPLLLMLLLAGCEGRHRPRPHPHWRDETRAASSVPVKFASFSPDPKTELAKFMRRKLDISAKITEGIASENRDILEGAVADMLAMSKSEKWNVLLDRNYLHYDRQFRTAMESLKASASDENYDAVIKHWATALHGCKECHKHVRSVRRANEPAKEGI